MLIGLDHPVHPEKSPCFVGHFHFNIYIRPSLGPEKRRCELMTYELRYPRKVNIRNIERIRVNGPKLAQYPREKDLHLLGVTLDRDCSSDTGKQPVDLISESGCLAYLAGQRHLGPLVDINRPRAVIVRP